MQLKVGLIFQPQHGIPDLFIWLISGNKRLAYQRIPARNILFSMLDEEKGKDCGSLQTLFLKVPFAHLSWFLDFFFLAKILVGGQFFSTTPFRDFFLVPQSHYLQRKIICLSSLATHFIQNLVCGC